MEFVSTARVPLTERGLQDHLQVAQLPALCSAIDTVLSDHGDSGRIYSLWGEFTVNRELIRDGVRFTLPDCPNALQWTVTSDPDESPAVTIHLSINKANPDPDFVASIEHFVDAWRAGLEALLD